MRFKRVYIEITNVCNLKCSFCPPHNRANRFMEFEEFKHILNQIKPYTQYIYLHVKGEPLLHPNVDEFIKYAYEEGFYINLTTNATLLHEHLAVTKYLRQINISLHATNSQEIVRIAKNIKEPIINFRVWNKNINQEAISLLEKEFNTIIPDTHNFTLGNNIFLSQEELFEWPDLSKEETINRGFCQALTSQIAILVDGTIVPCCLDNNGDVPLGSIFEESLSEVIASNKFQKILKGFQEGEKIEKLCQKCTFSSY